MPARFSALDEAQIVSQHHEGTESQAAERGIHRKGRDMSLHASYHPTFGHSTKTICREVCKNRKEAHSRKRGGNKEVFCFFVSFFYVILHVLHLIGHKDM